MSNFVRLVTVWLGIPPCWRTTSKAWARVMQARRPVKATELLSAELSNSTANMALVTAQDYVRLIFARPLFSGPTNLRAGCRCLLFLRVDAGPEGIHDIYHAWRGRSPNGHDLFPSLFLLE